MSYVTENILIILGTVCGALLAMVLINHFWSRERRRIHNDLIGWQLSVLGTTYAVILGFMLFTVWTTYGDAAVNADLEADSALSVFRVAQALPEPQRTQLQNLARSYVDSVLTSEWPQMSRGEVPERTSIIAIEMWKTVLAAQVASPTESNAQDHELTHVSELTKHRLTRIVQSANRLPTVLWCVLLIGGFLTICSACMFGSESLWLQAVQVFSFSLLIALSLVAIADIHQPFSGVVHVQDYPFRRAQEIMKSWGGEATHRQRSLPRSTPNSFPPVSPPGRCG
jgi:hypothetical protein